MRDEPSIDMIICIPLDGRWVERELSVNLLMFLEPKAPYQYEFGLSIYSACIIK